MMTNDQLQELVKRVSLTSFHRPFTHQAYFNSRLRTTGGRYRLLDHNVEINPRMLTEHDEATLVGVIKHELCHYHLHLAGQSGQHRTKAFKQLLVQVGGLRYAPAPPTANQKQQYQVYVCTQCGQIYGRRRRINVAKLVCGRCRGRLRWVKTVVGTRPM